MPDAVMLFAAGFGTRMGALTAERPKPLIEVAGTTLLDHALALADEAGIRRKIVNTHYLGTQIADHLANRPDVMVSHEQPDILDTGGGLRQALPLLGENPVFTLNTDAIWTGCNPLRTLHAQWDGTRMDGLLLLISPSDARGHSGAGDFVMDEHSGLLTRGPGAVYSGAQIIRTDLLDSIDEKAFSLNRLWDRMLERDRLFGCLHAGGWCDVGRPEGISTAEAMLAEAANA